MSVMSGESDQAREIRRAESISNGVHLQSNKSPEFRPDTNPGALNLNVSSDFIRFLELLENNYVPAWRFLEQIPQERIVKLKSLHFKLGVHRLAILDRPLR